MTNEVNLRIVQSPCFECDSGWNHQKLTNPHNTLYYVLAGDGHIRYEGETKTSNKGTSNIIVDLLPGYVYLIPNSMMHSIWCDTYIKKTYVDVYAEFFPGYDIFTGVDEVRSHYVGLEHCEYIYGICESKNAKDRLAFRGEVALELSGFIDDEVPPISPKMSSLLPIITEIKNNPSAKLTRSELAERHGWNESALSRTFKQVFGYGPKQYTEKLLTSHLTEDLLLTDMTLQQLADRYDFCDSYYLSAFFKRNVGVSPTDYRKSHTF